MNTAGTNYTYEELFHARTRRMIEEYEVTPGQPGYDSCKTAQDVVDLDQSVATDDLMPYVDNAIADGRYTVEIEEVANNG